MKKTLAILCLLALLGGCLAACGTQKPEKLLAGKWNADLTSFEFKAFEFVPGEDDPLNGTVNLGLIGRFVDGTYEVVPAENKDGRPMVKITYKLLLISTTRSYFFTVDATTLTLQKEGSENSMTYTRDKGADEGTTA